MNRRDFVGTVAVAAGGATLTSAAVLYHLGVVLIQDFP